MSGMMVYLNGKNDNPLRHFEVMVEKRKTHVHAYTKIN